MENIVVKELNNGLKLAVWEDHNCNVVELRIYVKTGSVYEQEYPGAGISHFLEHVTAEGPTLKKSKKEVDELMMRFGNAFNAYTSKDHTCYYITTTNEFYKEALELLGELVFENKITEEAFLREKGVILREIEKSMEEPDSYIHRMTSENLYKVHPAGFPVIGYNVLFEKITLSDLKGYYIKKYVPNNAVVVVGGDVEPDEIQKIIDNKFGDYKRNFYSVPPLPEEPEILNTREKCGFRDIEGVYMNLSWLTIPLFHPDLYSLDLLSEVLSLGRNARLNRILKEEKQIVNHIDSYSYTPTYGKGEFTISVRFKDSDKKEVEKTVLDVIGEIQKHGVSKEELERAKKLAVSTYLFGRTSITDNTARIGIDITTTGDEKFSYRYYENLKKVTSQDIQKAAQKYLNRSYARTLIIPKDETVKSYRGKEEIMSLTPKKIVLDNGIRVILKKVPGISVVNYAVYSLGGLTYDKHYNIPGLFNFFGSMLSQGTKKYNREELAHEFEKRGAGFNTDSGNNTFFIEAASLTEDYREIIELIGEIVLNPSFEEEEIKKLKKFTIQAIQQQKNDWQQEAFLNYKKHIFPADMPYVYSDLGTTESVKGITREVLMKVHKDFVLPSNMVISIVGDFDEDDMESKIKKVFSKFIGSKNTLPDYDEKILQLDKSITQNYSTGKELTVIFSGFPTVTIFDTRKRVLLDIIDAMISGSGYPSGWLHERLRGEKLVYVTHAYNLNFLKSGCFTMFAATNPEQMAKTLTVVEGVFKDLRDGKIY